MIYLDFINNEKNGFGWKWRIKGFGRDEIIGGFGWKGFNVGLGIRSTWEDCKIGQGFVAEGDW